MNDGNEVIVDLFNADKEDEILPQIATKMEQKGIVDLEVGAFSYPKN